MKFRILDAEEKARAKAEEEARAAEDGDLSGVDLSGVDASLVLELCSAPRSLILRIPSRDRRSCNFTVEPFGSICWEFVLVGAANEGKRGNHLAT